MIQKANFSSFKFDCSLRNTNYYEQRIELIVQFTVQFIIVTDFNNNVVSEYSETSEKPLIVNYYGRGKPVPGGVAAPPALRGVGGAGGPGGGACLQSGQATTGHQNW